MSAGSLPCARTVRRSNIARSAAVRISPRTASGSALQGVLLVVRALEAVVCVQGVRRLYQVYVREPVAKVKCQACARSSAGQTYVHKKKQLC